MKTRTDTGKECGLARLIRMTKDGNTNRIDMLVSGNTVTRVGKVGKTTKGMGRRTV